MTSSIRPARLVPLLHGHVARRPGGRVDVVVLGEVDSSNQVELGRLIAAAEAGRPDRLVLDLRRAPFLSFSALHLLAGARNRARAGGTSFEVLSDTRAVARSLRHLDLFP